MSVPQQNQAKAKRRWFSPAEKMKFVQASQEPGTSLAEVARKFNIGVSSLIKWRKDMQSGALMAVKSGESLVPVSEIKKLTKRVRELESYLGRKTAENEVLKEAVTLAREKKLISRQPLLGVEDFS